MLRKAHLSLILLPLLALACPGETGGSGSAGGGTVPAPGSAGSGSFVVIFDGQSALNDPNPNFKVVNSPATTVDALPTPPTKTHFTFGGWFAAKKGDGTQFTASSTVSGNMTVYAKWDPILTVKIGNLLWKKCAEGQGDGNCSGPIQYFQYCPTSYASGCSDSAGLKSGPIYDACNALNTTPSGGYGSKVTWRVPTIAELQSIMKCSAGINATNPSSQFCNSGSVAPTIDTDRFPNTYPSMYWSSNSLSGLQPFKFDFAYGGATIGGNPLGADPYDPYNPKALDVSGLATGYHVLRCVADDP